MSEVVELYELATGRLVIVLNLPIDLGLAARIMEDAEKHGLGFKHELAAPVRGEA